MSKSTVKLFGIEYWNDPSEVGDKSCTTYELFKTKKLADKFKKEVKTTFARSFIGEFPKAILFQDEDDQKGHVSYEHDLFPENIKFEVSEESKAFKNAV